MHIVLHCLTGRFGRCLEQRTHVHVEAAVGIAGGYYLGTAVVAVLTHFRYHDTGLTTLFLCKFLTHLLGADEVGILFCFVAVHA